MNIAHTRSMVRAALDGRARRRADAGRPELRGRGAARAARTCRPRSSTRARPGRTRTAYDAPAAALATMFRGQLRGLRRRRARSRGRSGGRQDAAGAATDGRRRPASTDRGPGRVRRSWRRAPRIAEHGWPPMTSGPTLSASGIGEEDEERDRARASGRRWTIIGWTPEASGR